jgi:hypothetical protein
MKMGVQTSTSPSPSGSGSGAVGYWDNYQYKLYNNEGFFNTFTEFKKLKLKSEITILFFLPLYLP